MRLGCNPASNGLGRWDFVFRVEKCSQRLECAAYLHYQTRPLGTLFWTESTSFHNYSKAMAHEHRQYRGCSLGSRRKTAKARHCVSLMHRVGLVRRQLPVLWSIVLSVGRLSTSRASRQPDLRCKVMLSPKIEDRKARTLSMLPSSLFPPPLPTYTTSLRRAVPLGAVVP